MPSVAASARSQLKHNFLVAGIATAMAAQEALQVICRSIDLAAAVAGLCIGP